MTWRSVVWRGVSRRGVAWDLERAVVRNDGVAEARTKITDHSRVSQVALEAGCRQLGGHVSKDGIGHAKVALRVFEVDRVDLADNLPSHGL